MSSSSIFVKAAAAAAVTVVFFTAYELVKAALFPQLPMWTSHWITIVSCALIAFITSVAVQWHGRKERSLLQYEMANFEAMIQHMPGLTCVVDTDRKFVRWNSPFQQMLGYTAEELRQMSAPQTLAEDYREIVPQKMGQAWTEGYAEMEAAWLTKQGRRIPCYLTGVRIFNGEQPCMLTVGIDISEQKRSEEDLRKSEEQYRRLLANLPDVTWTTNSAGGVSYISPNIESMLGYKPEEVLGGGIEIRRMRIHPDDQEDVASSFASLFAEGRIFDIEYRTLHKNGHWVWVHSSALRTFRKDGVLFADGILRDITTRKRAEEINSQLAAIVTSSSDAIIGNNIEGIIRSWNPAAEKMFGYTAAEATGQHISMLVAPERLYEVPPILSSISRGEAVPRFDSVCVRKDGSRIDISLAISAILDRNGNVLGVSTIANDISLRKQAENELLRAKEAAEAAARAKSEFLANISHELRTPMNGILGMTDLALDTSLDAEQREYLLTIKTSGRALLELIEKLLDFTLTESGTLSLKPAAFDLPEMLRQTVRPFIFQGQQVGLQVVYSVAPDVPEMVIGDNERLRQVLVNVVGNAVKFTHQGRVTVSLSCSSQTSNSAELLFTVSDTGIGIPQGKHAAIFQPFTQSDGSSTRKYGGTGMGLAICSKLVELMGGKMWVESEPGRGSTFCFTAQMALQQHRAAV